MRVFVYGSLMWDEWAENYGGRRSDRTVLPGYRRSFNKASRGNWGSHSNPCPTLGLERDESTSCVGTSFEFADERRQAVLEYLRKREGPDFTFPELDVMLSCGVTEQAYVPLNSHEAESYLGTRKLQDLAKSVRSSRGKKGTCTDYVANIRNQLIKLGITDQIVEEFYRFVCKVD